MLSAICKNMLRCKTSFKSPLITYIYNKKSFLLLLFICFGVNVHLVCAKTEPIEMVTVSHYPKSSGIYVGSPSLCILPNGDYIASHDEFGPNSSEAMSAVTNIFRSSDKGKTWQRISRINGQFWSNMFYHDGALYIMGTVRHFGNFVIRKSTDEGKTWSVPYKSDCGLLLEGEYHTAPVPVVYNKGRIWRALEYATALRVDGPKRYSAMVISAPVDSDLMNRESWTVSNRLSWDSTYLDGNFQGWFEGNAVVAPNGEIVNILRVDVPAGKNEVAAIVNVSDDGKSISFNAEDGFVPFAGGAKKFTIRYDGKSGRYWSLVNYVCPQFADMIPSKVRNVQVLCSSENLREWSCHKIILENADVINHGFQYVDFLFDGDDIIFLSRTAKNDEEGGAHNNHDANFLEFGRIPDFRSELINVMH